MIRLSAREIKVEYEGWTMTYYPTGDYTIEKDDDQVEGLYDEKLTDRYNDTLKTDPDKAKEFLYNDLKAWVKQAVHGEVVEK